MLNKFSVFQPNAWDNSIAPIDILHKIINNLNEVIDTVNAIEDTGFARAKEYTDEQITNVNSRISDTNAEITRIQQNFFNLSRQFGQLQMLFSNLDGRETTHYNHIQTQISDLYTHIETTKNYLLHYTDYEILQLKELLEAEINEIKHLIDNLLDVKCIDGFTGNYSTVREILGTRITQKTKEKGGNRYALTWNQLEATANGYLFNKSSRFSGNINIIAPTWYNLERNNYQFSTGQKATSYAMNLNTWGAFSNVTLLFLVEMVHKIQLHYNASTQAIADNYKNVDVFNYAEWQAWISSGETIPSVETVDVSTNYDGSNTYISLIVEQFKQSLSIFTGYATGYGLYSTSANSTNTLFGGVNDLPRLFQLLYGNINRADYSDYFI